MINNLLALALVAITNLVSVPMGKLNEAFTSAVGQTRVLSEHTFSLDDRYPNQMVNDVFKDNILLTLAYMNGEVKNSTEINWSNIEKAQTYNLVLKPNEVFAFHNDVLPGYIGKSIKTTNAKFNYSDGFKSDGYLFGDGVCHLASFIAVVAKAAGLKVEAPTDHSFANIPEVDRKDGVSIFYNPNTPGSNAQQNLYVTNTTGQEIAFVFTFDGSDLTAKVIN